MLLVGAREGRKVGQIHGVGFARLPACLECRPKCGGRHDAPADRRGPVDGSYSKVITDEEELVTFRIPDAKREVTEQVLSEIVTPAFVGSKDEIGIGVEWVFYVADKHLSKVVSVVDTGIGGQPDVPTHMSGRLDLSLRLKRGSELGMNQDDSTQVTFGEAIPPSRPNPGLQPVDLRKVGWFVPPGDDAEATHGLHLGRVEPGENKSKTAEALANVSRLVQWHAVDLNPGMGR